MPMAASSMAEEKKRKIFLYRKKRAAGITVVSLCGVRDLGSLRQKRYESSDTCSNFVTYAVKSCSAVSLELVSEQ